MAIKLAFYASSADFGVLAPRGWHCLDVGGSGGSWLFVSPIPIDSSETNSGPGVLVAWHAGGTSGRFQVAKLAARVFPAQAAFVKSVQDEDPRSEFPVGPYPADVLTYKSKTLVEYETPGMKEGLGTFNWLEKNGSPVYGAAILTNETSGTPDLVLISIRLPAQLEGLAPTIVQQIEQQIEHAVR